MTMELFSTSVASGLEPGRSGFCTVAMTRNLSRPLVEALESLSAYRPVFLPTDPRADENPVTVSYLRVSVAGRNYHVVSRICFAGLDYTNRSNRFAHHVVLDTGDPRPPGGPAWLAARPGFLEAKFGGKVEYIPAGRAVPAAAPPSAACPTWQKLTGDAGWAGVLAEALANPTARSFFLVYDLGTPVLTLLQEAIGLLPPERRWEATFTTYFTGLPAGVGCTVRGVLRGTAEAASAQGGASLDLGKLAGKTPLVNEWTQAARAGKAVASRQVHVNAPVPMKAGMPPSPSQLATPQPLALSPTAYPEEADPFGSHEPHLERDQKPGGVGKYVLMTVLASVLFLGGGVGAVAVLRPDLFKRSDKVVVKDGDKDGVKDGVTPIVSKDKTGTDGDKGKAKVQGKFKPSKAIMTMDRPVAGTPSILRVLLDYPRDAPPLPLKRLKFSIDSTEFSPLQDDGRYMVTFSKPGLHNVVAEYAGDERLEKVTMKLSVKALAPMPKFTLEATPTKAKRGEKIEVRFKRRPKEFTTIGLIGGLPLASTFCNPVFPKEFTGFGKIGLIGQGDNSKVIPSSDGKKPLVLTDLKPGKYNIKAKFPGDDTFAEGESNNAVEIRVLHKPVFEFTKIDREKFSRGKLDLKVTVKGEPKPKGTFQLMSETEVIMEGKIDAKGVIAFEKEGVVPKTYKLDLLFTPEDKELWETVKEPIEGTWQVIQTVIVKVDLEESTPKAAKDRGVRFKVSTGHADFKDLPSGKRFFLQFRSSTLPIKGAFEPRFELSETGQPKLGIRWKPGMDSWGMGTQHKNAGPFPVITVVVPDTEKSGTTPFDHSVKYTLNNRFPPPRGENLEAYIPLVPAFRDVAQSLHGAEIEVFEGIDKKVKVKDAKGKETDKTVTVRVQKDPKACPCCGCD